MTHVLELKSFVFLKAIEPDKKTQTCFFPKSAAYEIFRLSFAHGKDRYFIDVVISICHRNFVFDNLDNNLAHQQQIIELFRNRPAFINYETFFKFNPETFMPVGNNERIEDLKIDDLIAPFVDKFPVHEVVAKYLSLAEMFFNAFRIDDEIQVHELEETPLSTLPKVRQLIKKMKAENTFNVSIFEVLNLFKMDSVFTHDFIYYVLNDGSDMFLVKGKYAEKDEVIKALSKKYGITIPAESTASQLTDISIEMDMKKCLDKGGALELLARHGQQGIEYLGLRNIEALKALDKQLNVDGIQLDLCQHIWKLQVAEELEQTLQRNP